VVSPTLTLAIVTLKLAMHVNVVFKFALTKDRRMKQKTASECDRNTE
jgi:hypothetical protein